MSYDEYHQAEARSWRRELPTFYYHARFVEMLEFVAEHYAHVLRDEDRDFLKDFRRLSFEAQCLYVRLVNRKGRVFARSRLRYPELGEVSRLLAELDEQGWLQSPEPEHVDDILSFLTRGQLLEALRPRFVGMKTSMKKREFVDFAKQHVDDAELLELLPRQGILIQGRNDSVRLQLFLYFGRAQEGLSQFTMRDLGLVRAHAVKDSYEPRFQDQDEALEAWFFAARLAEFERHPERLEQLGDGVADWPSPQYGASAALRDQLAFRLGRAFEKCNDGYAALRLYEQGESTQCTERVLRLLLKSGQKDEAKAFLERCIDDPASDAEALFAADLYARKFGSKRTSTLTDLLRSADVIPIDEAHVAAPENAAAAFYEAQGVQAHRVENTLWRSFFGLLFWDLLFVDGASGLNSPFERLPASLNRRSFYAEHEQAIETRLGLLEDRSALKQALLKVSVRHYGTPNGVFRWRQKTLDALYAMIDVLPPHCMQPMLRRFCEDYRGSKTGYPDLMLIDGDEVRFVEVKTDGDHVRRNQLLRIEQLRAAGMRADVVRVQWVLDPQQVYVVVDVETTGGRGEQHRVTEIGAVKVRNGDVIDRFETLLNPQRSIPGNISRLTGITPAMVANAPYFVDIADEFEAFLGNAIFVAHNVEFDYRFIGQEFNRIGRSFRMPKLCTCASMRKLYPGHRSYSLAALTSAHDIKLDNHHRALCDAEAAAELLLLINEKREAKLTSCSVDPPQPARAGR